MSKQPKAPRVRTPTPADNEPKPIAQDGLSSPRAPGFAQAFKPGEKDYDENPVRPKGFKE